MEPIKVLPHHALRYFEFFYLKRNPVEYHQWYNSDIMKNEVVSRVQRVLANPDQLVQLVSGYDDWCRFCPYHRVGENPDTERKPCVRDGWNIDSEVHFAQILGLEGVLDKEPITSRQFLESMKPTYERLIAEPLFTDNNLNEYTLRQLFRYYQIPKTNTLDISADISRVIDEAKKKGVNPVILNKLIIEIGR